jgi:hypothetical protein
MRWGVFFVCAALNAQSLRVYSEFARINAAGEATAPARPREILSPAIVRNGFTSFQVVVQVPKGTAYWLYIGQNPEDAVRVTMYRESGARLEKTDLPFQSSSTEILWMDVWADRTAPVRRIKIEPELNISGDWTVYPMEARVMDAVVPDGERAEGYASPVDVARNSVCGSRLVSASINDAARMHFRNALQDTALAGRAPKEDLRRLVACDSKAPEDPEWYLRIRDYLFRTTR